MRASTLARALALALLLAVPARPAAQEIRAPEVPYVPTPPEVVREMLRVAGVGADDVVYDLGSGDGRIVIAAARDFGARGVGVDIDPLRVAEARRNASAAGVGERVSFIQRDLFETDLREATVVTLYLLPMVNFRLRPKLMEELRPGARVVSHAFDMADWNPDQELEVDGRLIFSWVVPARVAGEWRWSLPAAGGREYTARLEQSYQRVYGTVEGEEGPTVVREPHLSGTTVGFTLVERQGDEMVQMRYHGTVEGDTISGTVEVDRGALHGTHPWRAVRLGAGR